MEMEDESNQWVMNADCWRLVFDRLCIQDVVRCERVSRGWQRAVKEYLSGVHNFWVDGHFYYINDIVPQSFFENKRGIYDVWEEEIFCNMIHKLAPYMKSLTFKADSKQFWDVMRHCPNIEDLSLIEPSCHDTDMLKKFKHLRRLFFYKPMYANDDQLNEIVKIESLEELAIYENYRVVGRFLTNLNQNLKILKISGCEIIVPEQITSCASWPGMKHLQLADVMGIDYDEHARRLQRLALLLDKMPNLEYFGFTSSYYITASDDTFLNSISQLSQLRELHLVRSIFVTDVFLTRVARALVQLEEVDVSQCSNVTAAGVLELCRARPTLKSLGLGSLPLSDADVEACVRYCEGLEYLDVSSNDMISARLLLSIARPRVRPLHIRLDRRVHITDVPEKLEGLKITWYDWTN